MTEGDFPFRSFTGSEDGYDRSEVDAYVAELQSELRDLRRARDEAGTAGRDVRLHDPEGAVQRTLAIAQETADRVLHDAQVEADRRRTEADEQASASIADAEARAAKMLADIEAQTAEMRAQGVAAARSAIQVERDKAVAELGQIRRVRDDIRAEAVELKSVLDRYSNQARNASDALSAAASGPLVAVELPEFVAADVALAGVVTDDAPDLYSVDESDDEVSEAPLAAVESDHVVVDEEIDDASESEIELIEVDLVDADDTVTWASDLDESVDEPLADVIAIDGDTEDIALDPIDPSAETASFDDLPSDLDESSSGSGAFLAEVRAAADADDDIVDLVDDVDAGASDRFLAELRGAAESAADDADDDVADQFFDVD